MRAVIKLVTIELSVGLFFVRRTGTVAAFYGFRTRSAAFAARLSGVSVGIAITACSLPRGSPAAAALITIAWSAAASTAFAGCALALTAFAVTARTAFGVAGRLSASAVVRCR